MSSGFEKLDRYFRDELLGDFAKAFGTGEDYASIFTDCLKSILTRKSEARAGGVYISPLEVSCIPFLIAVGLIEEREINTNKTYFLTNKAKALIDDGV